MKNNTPCGFCEGTGIEPGETNCIWCDNTGIDWAGRPGDIPVARPAVDPLRIALEHIQKTVGQSRTQTRRLRWIGKRAELALAGRPYVASEHDLPPNGDSEHFKLLRQKATLKERVDQLQGSLLQATPSKVAKCRECGGTSLTWAAHNENRSGIQEGRLRTHEVTCVFVLGCDDCSETLAVVSADSIAAYLPLAALKPAEVESNESDR